MRGGLTALGVAGSLVLVAISASLSFMFARTIGGTPEEGMAYGIACATLDVLKAVSPFFVAAWLVARKWAAAAAAALVFLIGVVVSFTSAVGLAGHNRLDRSGSFENLQAQFVDARRELSELEARLAALKRGRSSAEIDAAVRAGLDAPQIVTGSRTRTLAAVSDNCVKPDRATADACARVQELRQELAAAVEWERIERQAFAARARVQQLRSAGAGEGRHGDVQAGMLARMLNAVTGLGVTVSGMQLWLVVLIALALEVGSSFGLYAALGTHAPLAGQGSGDAQAPPKVVQPQPLTIDAQSVALGEVNEYCFARLEAEEGGSLTLPELHADYACWCDASGLSPLSLSVFRERLSVFVAEAGFPITRGRLTGFAFKDDVPAPALLAQQAAE